LQESASLDAAASRWCAAASAHHSAHSGAAAQAAGAVAVRLWPALRAWAALAALLALDFAEFFQHVFNLLMHVLRLADDDAQIGLEGDIEPARHGVHAVGLTVEVIKSISESKSLVICRRAFRENQIAYGIRPRLRVVVASSGVVICSTPSLIMKSATSLSTSAAAPNAG